MYGYRMPVRNASSMLCMLTGRNKKLKHLILSYFKKKDQLKLLGKHSFVVSSLFCELSSFLEVFM